MVNFYNNSHIAADLEFLKYQIKNCNVKLLKNTGLHKLIHDCEFFLERSIKKGKSSNICAIPALNALTYSLKILWRYDISFDQQLKSMNSGSYDYGQPHDENKEIYYKDFEFELFSAAHLALHGLEPNLPDNTEGNDIFCQGVEIQCKHPNSPKKRNMRRYLTKFNKSLEKNQTYGIFALAIEDCFNYGARDKLLDENDFNDFINTKRAISEKIMSEIIAPSISSKRRILGIYTTSTYYTLIHGICIRRDANSVFYYRPDIKEIQEETYKNVYKILCCFNPSPNWITL